MKLSARGERLFAWVGPLLLLALVLAFGRVETGESEGFPERTVPVHVVGHWPCVEDEVLVGVGDFADGEWSGGWRCDARDDR